MWQDVLMMMAVSLGIYSICNFIFIIVKKLINRRKVSKIVYSFKSKRRYYPLFGVIILIINMMNLAKKQNEEVVISKYVWNINKFYSAFGSLNKFIICIFSIFLVINFILSIYIRPIMYEEGIICENGNFLPWDRIKSITTAQNTLGNIKYIVINTFNKVIYLRVPNKESNEVKEIIFNKTGIVNKEIVTEFN